jgi:hypothetical protein
MLTSGLALPRALRCLCRGVHLSRLRSKSIRCLHTPEAAIKGGLPTHAGSRNPISAYIRRKQVRLHTPDLHKTSIFYRIQPKIMVVWRFLPHLAALRLKA